MEKGANSNSKAGFYFIVFLGLVFVLYLTYDMIITNILGSYYCSKEPNPKTKIIKKVEYPISIYWEDNVYPGFSKQDRELMIINYLDGVHLKTMALNGDDSKVYVYHTTQDEVKKIKQKIRGIENVIKYNKAFAAEIMQNKKVYTKQTMPKTNYTVTFNEVKLPSFARKFLYSDETKVIENSTGKVIAYNRRYMHFFYKLQPDFAGGRYYYPEPVCGENSQYFFLKVFQKIKINSGFVAESFSSKLYRKYIKGDK